MITLGKPRLQKTPLNTCIRQALTPLLYTTAALAALPQMSAFAAEANKEETEEILVTGSRIRTSGMESPNPMTVITLDQVELINPVSLVDALAELPIFNSSSTSEGFNTANANFNFFASPGNGSLNLRGIGTTGTRTLTLLNGRRVVNSTLFGGPSITMFPQQLMRSVEAVTGGASAAYGTDAVSGVVNYILNTDFEGFRASSRYGVFENGRGTNYGYGFAGGFKIGEKAHALFSVDISNTNPINGREGFDWFTNTRYMTNTATGAGESPSNPRNIPRPNVVARNSSLDGVINFPTHTALSRYALDANGNATPFQLGSYFSNTQNSLDGGGSGAVSDQYSRQLRGENKNENYFTYLDYDVNDQLNVFLQGMYGTTFSSTNSVVNTNGSETLRSSNGLTSPDSAPMIFSGNPFIPANIQQLMTANNVPYLKLGKHATPQDLDNSLRLNDSAVTSVTTGFKYQVSSDGFFNEWQVNGWYQKGHTDTDAVQTNPLRQDRYYLALDAIKDPANPNNIICNVSRFPNAPQNAGAKGCVPYNPFGRGRASPEAVAWVTGYEPGTKVAVNGYFLDDQGKSDPIYYEYVSDNDKARILDLRQDAWELAADGKLFDGWGAGPISMALGYAWREESYQQVVQAAGVNPGIDPRIRTSPANSVAIGRRGISQPALNSAQDVFISGGPFGKGSQEVKEAFTEFNIPVLANVPFVKEFVFGAAARWASYEGPGDVWSWKGQFSWRVNDELRFRGTVSQDVRAANMAERTDRNGAAANLYDILEDPGAKAIGVTAQYQALTTTFGSTTLSPEEGKTFTAGFVYQPSWLDGLQFSLDWYDLTVSDNITQSTNAQEVLDNCYEDKIEQYCQYILRDGADITATTAVQPGLKRISNVLLVYLNQDWITSGGVDFELSYNQQVSLLGGNERMSVRFLGSYLDFQNQKNGATITKRKGRADRGLTPWQTNLNFNYSRDNFSASLGTTYEWGANEASWFRNLNGFDIADNSYHYQIAWNGRVGYNFRLSGGSNISLGLNVNNLFDKQPRPNFEGSDGVQTNAGADLFGRRYSLSANFTY